MILNSSYICLSLTANGMSTFSLNEAVVCSDENDFGIKSFNDNSECVFKKCCEKYKKKGKHCKKCPKK